MFRTRNFEKDKRKRAKKESRFNWWKKNPGKFGKPVMMMKVPYTHGSKLLKKYKRVAESHSMEIKFVELSGYSLQNMLEKANPFGDGKCGRDDCFPCRSGKGKCCQKRGAAYEIVCCEEECREDNVKYCGESGRNGYSRGLDHLAGYRRKAEGNPLWKHAVDKHGGRLDVDFRMEVVDTFGRDNTARMTDESLRISRHKGVKFNSKKEYRQPSLPRLQIQRGRNSQ